MFGEVFPTCLPANPPYLPISMYLGDFDFDLPADLIAQEPLNERGSSRLLKLDRESGAVEDHQFRSLPRLLRRGDLLVVNDTRVFAARLLGRRLPGGGQAECLLLRRVEPESGPSSFNGARRQTGLQSSRLDPWGVRGHMG